MNDNPLLKLEAFGQSIWMDFIRRGMISSGQLKRVIEEDGLRGVTSNPSIFEKAIVGSHDYDSAIRALALEGKSVDQIYETLTVEDVQCAADLFRPIYDRLDEADGFVSLEVSPYLARDTAKTIADARRLWIAIARPNVMIKVPATIEGLPAIRQLIGEGINVNITLLFGLPRYRQVAEAYISGLETLSAQGKPLKSVASVASLFLSRIDVLLDPTLEKLMATDKSKAAFAETIHGQVAIFSAKAAYQIYKDIYQGERFGKLKAQGARTQHLLWASTSTKNPAYSDLKYVEALVGPETIDTIPLETFAAYRDHGKPASRLTNDAVKASETLRRLDEVGIDLDAANQQLEDEGIQKFAQAFDLLMNTLTEKRAAAMRAPVDVGTVNLSHYEKTIHDRIAVIARERLCDRLWSKDASSWKTDDENRHIIRNGLGWLHVAEHMEEHLETLTRFVSEVTSTGFRYVVDMGMGGSSLAPLAFQHTFATAENALRLIVLDTTDPVTIQTLEHEVVLSEALFIVVSKSGTTAEPLAFGEYFYAKLKALKGDRAGENFVAITDPNTPLVKLAQARKFRRIFLNFADIGGRYSALSYFGLLPAALMGVDIGELLIRALRMTYACASCVPAHQNPGMSLGAMMGELARERRDKVTFVVSKPIGTLRMWLEQLLAESTGKEGRGMLPVSGEPLGDPSVYGQDRFFVYFRLKDHTEDSLEQGVTALREAAHPVVTIQLNDPLDLGQEFFRWEIATATAGAILGINPFDQPNVQESKDNKNRLLETVKKQGRLPEETPVLVEHPLSLYAPKVAATVTETLQRFLAQAHADNYVTLMACLTETPATEQALYAIRHRLRDSLRLATTLGYGPRFLDSTGQFHKGGQNTGLCLQLTADDAVDLPVPGQPYTFGIFKRAEALGDLEALRKHQRRVIRIHLGADVGRGLAALTRAIDTALLDRLSVK
ncbi:MAG TPA: bifunctional transaldolase/phosoglucose isomerase [Nitrospira sp.]|nr:bifunctional transaldolase/phosoglucose isomerase [Nitrospira sp.]